MCANELDSNSKEDISKAERLQFIDALKGIGILFVVIGHHLKGIDAITEWISSFHMPLFFIITGFLTERKSENRTLKEIINVKAKSILWPYMTFSILMLVWYILYYIVLHLTADESLTEVLIKTITTYGYHALWFLPTMFWAVVLYNCIINNKYKSILVFLMAVVGCFLAWFIHEFMDVIGNYKYFFVYVERVLIATSFVYLGFEISRFLKKCTVRIEWIAILIAGGISIVGFRFNSVSLATGKIGNPFLYYLLAISGSLFFMLICKNTLVGRNKTLSYLGRNSLIIMAIHMEFPIEIAWIILGALGIPNMISVQWASCIAICIEIFIEIGVIEVIRHYGLFMLTPSKRKVNYVS